MHFLADIATGQTATADVVFLIAAVCAVLAAVAYMVPVRRDIDAPSPNTRPFHYTAALVAITIGLIALGLMLQ